MSTQVKSAKSIVLKQSPNFLGDYVSKITESNQKLIKSEENNVLYEERLKKFEKLNDDLQKQLFKHEQIQLEKIKEEALRIQKVGFWFSKN